MDGSAATGSRCARLLEGLQAQPESLHGPARRKIIIAAPRQRVYDALNDAEVLRDCIPGCEELTKGVRTRS